MNKEDWEIIKTITQAEHHFNDLCFKIRALASTWLLATFAGVGFFLSKSIQIKLEIEHLLVILCWAGSIGIIVLWILDLQIYQKLLNAWFDAREPIEIRNKDFPQIRENIKATQPKGRASNLIKTYYIALCAAPLGFSIYFCLYRKLPYILTIISIFLFICFVFIIYKWTPGKEERDQAKSDRKRKKRKKREKK